ncbi:MAG: hypothetical protein IBJ16_09270 [Chitinophagaceae bacterium]|nr:hypothetical protein [Chitinophagaceae bacterium]
MNKLNADEWAAIIAFIALALSIVSIISNNRLASITKKSKFIDETRSFNDLMIQHPELKKIYLQDNDPLIEKIT